MSAVHSRTSSPITSSPIPRRNGLRIDATPDVVNRPSFLPPKSNAELQKHMKEYEDIAKQIKKSMEKDAKEKAKQDQLRCEREKKMPEYRRMWVEEVIPNWEKKKGTKKVQEMWWAGIPPAVRGKIWNLCFGNELRITPELYDISLAHAKETKRTIFGEGNKDESPCDLLIGKEATLALVELDELPKQFPARPLFSENGPMRSQLIDVLEAYVSYRPDVGYVQGMSFLAAVFLLNMETIEAFTCLANFINRPFILSFYITDRHEIYKYTRTADIIIEAFLPKVHKHFRELEIAPEHYLIDWFMTVYSKVLPLDVATRIWDIYLLEGEIFLFRVALALLKLYSHEFETFNREACISYLNDFPDDLNVDDLLDTVNYYVLDNKKFQKILQTAESL